MQIATWNINGVRARLEGLKTWLIEAQPDVVCLQEIKTPTEAFPTEDIEQLGYNLAVHGEKGFNGVAILSKRPFERVTDALPGDPSDSQSRYLEVVVPAARGSVRIASIYLPNGNPIGTDKFQYKLAWMQRLESHTRTLLDGGEAFVLAGDFNVIAEPRDARTPAAWVEDALFQPQSRRALRSLLSLGLTDALRACNDDDGVYTFWDYQAGAWNKDHGIRIDFCLLSPPAADRLQSATIDRRTRAWEKPSDHVPVRIDLAE